MNSLVTGGAGFIGSHLDGNLINGSHSVMVANNFFWGKKENLRHLFDHPRFHFVQGSITDPGLLKSRIP